MKKEVILTFRMPEDSLELWEAEHASVILAGVEAFEAFLYSGEHTPDEIKAKFEELVKPVISE